MTAKCDHKDYHEDVILFFTEDVGMTNREVRCFCNICNEDITELIEGLQLTKSEIMNDDMEREAEQRRIQQVEDGSCREGW